MKLSLSRRLAVATAAALLLCTGLAQAQERLRIAGNFASDHSSSIAMQRFKKDVEAASKGQLIIEVFDNQHFTFFRTDEFDTNFNGAPGWNAFVEYRPSSKTSLTLDVNHVFGKRNRLLFFPNRAEPDTIINEYRERDQHISIGLTLKQSFGVGGAKAVASKDK